ncbi:hypothetical protein RND71_016762 [Anisodus tanguticus]|uniref:PLAC8 family protein n=1 Tax=Anisodus tanguticus TaxID=243964 RepID=A0AAE1S943_9SOLA|nr:hypothetical protein RND71_016762 [Anisodus tanguticus]
MASQQAFIDKANNRKFFQNLWRTDLMGTLKADPPYWCFALWCGPCSSYVLRKRALYGDMRRYKCCAGYMPCSGRCGESKCPEFAYTHQVCCCFGNSVGSTRFRLQDELNIKTTKCDNCIIGTMVVLGYLACLCRILALVTGDDEIEDAAHILTCMSDTVYYTLMLRWQTQHKIELDKRDGKFGDAPMTIPPMQQMSRLDQPYGPTVGYPPSYGVPPYGQPQPPPQQGYPAPAPGFPPSSALGYNPGGYPPPQQQPGYWR